MRMTGPRRSGILASMRSPAPPPESRWARGRSLGLAVVLAGLMVGLPASDAVARAGSPSPYRRSLNRIDAQLRLAIESRPAVLGEYMRSSEIVCGLAERSEARGDAEGSRSNWTTLSQTVEELDLPASRAVDDAFREADASLEALRKTYSARWRGQPAKVRQLARGVRQARRGVSSLRAAMGAISASFSAWNRRECAAAHDGIEAGVKRISPALDLVNLGMLRLWRLSEP